jgi:hypothetical protein
LEYFLWAQRLLILTFTVIFLLEVFKGGSNGFFGKKRTVSLHWWELQVAGNV